jgi:hypothetical protein
MFVIISGVMSPDGSAHWSQPREKCGPFFSISGVMSMDGLGDLEMTEEWCFVSFIRIFRWNSANQPVQQASILLVSFLRLSL